MLGRKEVALWEAIDMTDLDEDELGKLIEDGTLKARRVREQVYFDVASLDDYIDRSIEEARKGRDPGDFVCQWYGPRTTR
jgi:hypothetical protein